MTKKLNEELTVYIGNPAKHYRVGDYLTALDELTCYFEVQCNCLRSEMAQALKLYADKVEGGM